MEELAKAARLNGETTTWTYGAVPNKKEVRVASLFVLYSTEGFFAFS